MIFVPKERDSDSPSIGVDINKILSSLTEGFSLSEFNIDEEYVKVNMGSIRYQVFKKSRTCACCGLIGTHMYLEKIDNYSGESSNQDGCGYHFNLYAKSKDHMIRMTTSNTIDEEKEISVDNLQTLCFTCHRLQRDSNLSIDRIKDLLFNAYRSYKSTQVLNLAKEKLLPLKRLVNSRKIAIENITSGLSKVKDKAKVKDMLDKIEHNKKDISILEEKIFKTELLAQTDSLLPEESLLLKP